MDYGRPLEFGISVAPETASLATIRTAARAADDYGIDLIGIQDHPYQRRFLDTFSLIGSLLAETTRVRIFPDVANLPLRPPAMLAKQAATLDVLSGGRFDLGLGAGAFWDAIAAMGGPRRRPGEAVEAFEEAIAIIRQAWSDVQSVRFRGTHYVVDGYRPGPMPAHDIGIWVGAYKPRMLRLIGRLADGWIPSLGRTSLAELAAQQTAIDDAARAAHRDPASIRRMLNVGGSIGGPPEDGALGGGVDDWVGRLTGWAIELGIDTFIIWLSSPDPAQIEMLGTEVGPRTREDVARRRGGEAGTAPSVNP
jgi:alkanesulfonate monooxygenase SsuD/methylene tetrahydromethanopterin reductase-like flavin-dependent oxidoreductase (luciferase family)